MMYRVGGVRLIAAGQKISGNNLIGGILSRIWEEKNKKTKNIRKNKK